MPSTYADSTGLTALVVNLRLVRSGEEIEERARLGATSFFETSAACINIAHGALLSFHSWDL
jgi:hypothetical protein